MNGQGLQKETHRSWDCPPHAASQEGLHPVCLEDLRIAGPGDPVCTPIPCPPQPPHVFPSWNGSAVVIILPLFHCVGQVIYFIVLLSFIGLWVKKGGIRPYWETTMPHLGIQEHSTKHNSDYDTAVTAGCLTPHLLSPLPQIIELLVFSWTQNNSS